MSRALVLVVMAEAAGRASVASALSAEGYEILTASTFPEGRTLLLERRPDVLVTGLRLQEHNGIHLAIVSRARSPQTKTIVIGYGDPVLQAEAGQAGARYLTDPGTPELVAAVDGLLHRPERRWPRARANMPARAADQLVRLLDLSYGGFRIELTPGTALPKTNEFDLFVGDLRVSALPVWTKQQNGAERVQCGAIVAGNGESNGAWRQLVDGVLMRHEAGT